MKYVILFLTIFFTWPLQAQQPVFVFYPPENYPPVAGRVYDLYSNGHDFIWMATGNGLLRFDGLQFAPVSLPEDITPTALAQDSSGLLWIAGNQKLYSLDPSTGRFKSFDAGTLHHAVNSIFSDNGALWMATAGGGILIKTADRFIRINSSSGLSDDYVYCFEKDKEGNIWAGTDQGITIMSARQPYRVLKKISINEGLPDAIVRRIKLADDSTIWIGMQQAGIACINTLFKVHHVTPSWNSGEINDLVIDGTHVWAATQRAGMVLISNQDALPVSFSKTERQLFVNVSAAIKTADGFIWFTAEGRLYKTPGMKWTWLNNINGNAVNNVHSVFADSKNNLWFTPDNGLLVLTENHQLQRHLLPGISKHSDISCFYEDDCSNIWIGTLGNGLYRYDRRTSRIFKVRISPDKSEFQNIISISGRADTIWIATFGGVFKTTKNNCEEGTPLLNSEQNKAEQQVGRFYGYHVFIDSKGKTWMATDGNGLACYDKQKVKYFDVTPFSKENVVYSITEDKEGCLWLSIHQGGLLRFDGNQFRQFTVKDGLKSNDVRSVIHDGNGHLVLTYENGLDFFDTKTGFVYSPGKEFGFENINPDLNAVTLDYRGNIWIGTKNGIIRLAPDYRTENIRPGLIFFNAFIPGTSEFVLNGQSLKHNQNLISLMFYGFWHPAPEQLVYRYKLNNSENWIYTSDRQVVLSGLNPGRYEVVFQASHHPSFLFPAQNTFRFIILKPFWKTTWFQALLAVVVAVIILSVIRFRQSQMRKVELLEKEKTIYRYETLKSQVNPHFLFNSLNTLISVIETESREEASRFAQQLSDFFRSSLALREKDIISLREELAMAESFANIIAKRFGNSVEIITEISKTDLDKKILPMALQMLIENALKHNMATSENPLKIKIKTKDGYIFISNNIQPKKNPETSTGTGLQNIIKRYHHYGREDVEIINDGKMFTVKLPLLNGIR